MASRAATLVKPKPKTKAKAKTPAKSVSPKSVSAKSLASKSTATAKAPAAPPASTTATPSSKANSSKVTITNTPLAKTPSAKAPLAKSPVAKSPIAKATIAKPASLKSKPKAAVSKESVLVGGAASFETAAPKPRRRGKAEIRTRIYWAVFNQALRRVAVFEFDQRAEAEKRAAKLTKSSGEHHFLQKIKAIVQ